MDGWGPIVLEYYGASEGHGSTAIGPHEWLARRGSVGRGVGCTVSVADEAGRLLPPGEVVDPGGHLWRRQRPPPRS